MDSYRRTSPGAKQRERAGRDSLDPQSAAARVEVVDILAGAVFTLILEGRLPAARADGPEQEGEPA